VSGAMKTLWEFIRYETKRKKQKDTIEQSEKFSLIRSHLTISIILALLLFIIKFLDDAVEAQPQTAYLYLLALVVILVIMIFFYKKDKSYVPKK
jgi:L-asparagine transporter-like permease